MPGLNHVINYDFPRHMVDYVHRAGRVGRCGAGRGQRITSFVRLPHEVQLVNRIEVSVGEDRTSPGQLTVRLNRPLTGVETDVAGRLREREAQQSLVH